MSVISIVAIWAYILLFQSNLSFPVFPYLALSVLSIPLSLLISLQTSEYKMEKQSSSFFRLSVSSGVANVIMNIILVVLLKQGAFGKLIAPLLVSSVVCLYVLTKNRDFVRIQIPFNSYKATFAFCWPLAMASLLEYFTSGFDKTYMMSLNDTTTYGIYIVAYQMAAYVGVFSGSITSTFQPDIYESIIKNQNKRLWKTYLTQFSLILLVVIAFVFFCPLIIRLLTAGRYVAATPYARIIVFFVLTQNIFFCANNYTIAKGYPKISLATTIIGSLVMIIVVPIIIGKYRFYGAAYMSSISYLIYATINILIVLGFDIVHRFKRE